MKAMADNKYNFWGEICDIFVQNMVRFQPRPQGLPPGGARAEEDPGKIR
jgi:hypothetical protein